MRNETPTAQQFLYLPQDRYVAALKRALERITEGLELSFWDDTTIGNKEIHNSWGLCSRDKEAWPDPEDHIWPDQFVERGRVAPRYKEQDQRCPFDRRAWEEYLPDSSGCFWYCMFFTPKERTRPNIEQARALYASLIERCLT